MNKLDLVAALHQESGLTPPEAATAVGLFFFNQITKAITSVRRVEIRRFCSLQNQIRQFLKLIEKQNLKLEDE